MAPSQGVRGDARAAPMGESSTGAQGAASFGRIGTGTRRQGGFQSQSGAGDIVITGDTTAEQLLRFVSPASPIAKAGLAGMLLMECAPGVVSFEYVSVFSCLFSGLPPTRTYTCCFCPVRYDCVIVW